MTESNKEQKTEQYSTTHHVLGILIGGAIGSVFGFLVGGPKGMGSGFIIGGIVGEIVGLIVGRKSPRRMG